MLKLYICPNCKLVRYVSLYNITCYKCNIDMLHSQTTYLEFINLDDKKRAAFIDNFLIEQNTMVVS